MTGAAYTEHAADAWLGMTLGELASFVAACEIAGVSRESQLRVKPGLSFSAAGARVLAISAECRPVRPRILRGGFGRRTSA